MEHFKKYTPEQEAKIEALRAQNQKEIEKGRLAHEQHQRFVETYPVQSTEIGVDTRVYVEIEEPIYDTNINVDNDWLN